MRLVCATQLLCRMKIYVNHLSGVTKKKKRETLLESFKTSSPTGVSTRKRIDMYFLHPNHTLTKLVLGPTRQWRIRYGINNMFDSCLQFEYFGDVYSIRLTFGTFYWRGSLDIVPGRPGYPPLPPLIVYRGRAQCIGLYRGDSPATLIQSH